VSLLTDGGFKQRCNCFKRWRKRLLLFPSPLFSFLFFYYVSFSFCSCLDVFFSNLVPLPVSVSFFLNSHGPSPLSLTVPLGMFSLLFSSFSFSSNPHSPFPLSLSPPCLRLSPFSFLFFSIPFLFVLFFLFSSFPFFFFFPPLRAGVESLFIGPRERGLFIVVHGEQGNAGLAGGRGSPSFSS